ncbi:hypothetical protein BH09BAC4_BH09BAC4_32690 [soil metagenome]
MSELRRFIQAYLVPFQCFLSLKDEGRRLRNGLQLELVRHGKRDFFGKFELTKAQNTSQWLYELFRLA